MCVIGECVYEVGDVLARLRVINKGGACACRAAYGLVFGTVADARDARDEAVEFVHDFAVARPDFEGFVEAAREYPHVVFEDVLFHV